MIARPRAQVFDVFSDIGRAGERIAGIERVEVLSEVRAGMGLRWRETRVMFGKEATEEMEITSFEEPTGYRVEAESHGTHYTSWFRFDAIDDDSTRVTWEFAGEPRTLVAKLMSPLGLLFKGATEKMLRKDIDDLKRHLEQTAPVSPV